MILKYGGIMIYKLKMAFTLAEVLITLLIIGIVASIVIPTLLSDTQQAEYKVAWKKAYASINQAAMLIKADNSGTYIGAFSSPTTVFNSFSNYMSVVKVCKNNDAVGNCWGSQNYYLNGVTVPSTTGGFAMILSNGTSILVPSGWIYSNSTGAAYSTAAFAFHCVCKAAAVKRGV
jgi:prepilin-type N-terminal cleavage/methylation domain-containing protein